MTPIKNNTFLSKSLFLRGLQCHKSLYLHKFHPELKDETSEPQESLYQSGTDVGVYARQLFPCGVEVPFEGMSIPEQIERTSVEIKNGANTIYEASFNHDDVFVKVDILHKDKDGWGIYEVKSSTSVKDVHINDAAVQYYTATGAGLNISKVAVVHINNQYVKDGEIAVNELFTVSDITETVREMQGFVNDELGKMREMLNCDTPQIDIGEHCSDPYDCDFHGHCWSHVPEDSVFSIRGRGVDRFDLYRQGIVRLKDVPLTMLSGKQRIQVEAALTKKNIFNRDGVKEFFNTLRYPLYFFDFETFMSPIPLFDGTRPYQQIPFQYSLFCQEKEGAELLHHEYLAQPKTDPREELIKKLLDEIPEGACVMAYNKTFEIMVLRSLSAWFPEYAERIEAIIANMVDLMVPFKNMDVYHYEMNGSYSIKAVLPVLVPELTYEGMEVGDGGMAMDAYARMCRSEDLEEVKQIRKALLEYCKLDTLAMVRILEKLKTTEAV